MADAFATIVEAFLGSPRPGRPLPAIDPVEWLAAGTADATSTAAGASMALAAAFVVHLAGPDHPLAAAAAATLADPPPPAPVDLAALLRTGAAMARAEVDALARADPGFGATMASATTALGAADDDPGLIAEALWSVFCPEAAGLTRDIDGAIGEIRARRTVRIEGPAARPIVEPQSEVLFTSNVLLGLPLEPATPTLDPEIAAAVERARTEPQAHWFDHPVPIGVEPEHDEVLYGLRGLDAALAFEQHRRPVTGRATCLLSVSVTHPALRDVARRYVESALERDGSLGHLDVLVVSETDARRLVDEVLIPAARRYLGEAGELGPGAFDVVGVDGEYGRHYSFLKAIAALWSVLVDDRVRATFKFDLDQVFPQEALVAETGRSALEHLATGLWGATGRDAAGHPVELGMLAGALVNERDIGRGLFTPDVPMPAGPTRADELVFYSVLPQAASTMAEMGERYDGGTPDGETTALERVHVTGGTTGIRVDALRRHRPFTPSFVGRAEDQAYVLSVLDRPASRLAYAHAAGLVMRHDKEAFAGAAIAAAEVGKSVGDHVRILVFSALARATGGVPRVKDLLDPFTGAFVSRLPVTVTLLRFALRLAAYVTAGETDRAAEFAEVGARRLREALELTADPAAFADLVERERRDWERYYDVLDALEAALAAADPEAIRLRDRARAILDSCRADPGRAGALG